MSVSMSRTDGVTILTLTTDPQSPWPPLCQVFNSLCCSPVCCSVSKHLRSIQNGSQTILGLIQIMVGILNIGLGLILTYSGVGSGWQMDETAFPYWMGAFFVVFGVVSILCERYPSACLLVFNMFLHVVGVVFAITAIALYSNNISHIYLWGICDRDSHYFYKYRTTTPNGSSQKDEFLKEKCEEGRDLILILLQGISAVLIILSVLELCVTLSSFGLGIKYLRSKDNGPNKTPEDPESIKPLLEEVSTSPTA
ncbi:membrane-spanning 4-domains subfamily A member 8-like [Gouania willdenowi]|uniref:Uncharacterized protein n=1 Tax=Gouania willdenowi TaxID=441366 RepID=A0A8C5DCF0_GOUWI|nr:membrane-spanning 4-domains subfamily A member 8 [Gouania willdenowi]